MCDGSGGGGAAARGALLVRGVCVVSFFGGRTDAEYGDGARAAVVAVAGRWGAGDGTRTAVLGDAVCVGV